jgi:hypothetical protein
LMLLLLLPHKNCASALARPQRICFRQLLRGCYPPRAHARERPRQRAGHRLCDGSCGCVVNLSECVFAQMMRALRCRCVQAAEFGHLECVQRILEAKANTKAKNHRHHGPLIRACAGGHLGVVECLITAKCNVRAPSKHGIMTPLVWAARKGYRPVVRLLLHAKADVESRRSDDADGTYLPEWVGLEALNEAAKKGHTLVVKDLARSRELRLAEREAKLATVATGGDSFGF